MNDVRMKPKFSLLGPLDAAGASGGFQWGSNTITDLDLEQIALAFSVGPQYRETIKATLFNLTADARTIDYRQQVLDDFLTSNGVAAGFEELLPILGRLHDSLNSPGKSAELSMNETLGRLTELSTYVTCVGKLQAFLGAAGSGLHSQGLRNLRDWLDEIAADDTFRSLETHLPELVSKLRSIPSVTIGINLDNELRPVEATLLSVNDKPFKGGSLLQQLMGKKTGGKQDQGIAQLHALPYYRVDGVDNRTVRTSQRVDPMMVPLFKDLVKVVQSVISPISSALKQYAKVNANFLVALEEEAAFYLGAVRLIHKMQEAGLPMCRPEILPTGERACEMQGLYNLRLALDLYNEKPELCSTVVQNELKFGPEGRIFILTGPNQGGKTVYTQAVGIAQVLFQAGLHVPAETARISPADGIYTHFAIEEKSIQGMGRLSEESKRLGEIFQSVTRHGLVLLNESLSSTSSGESLYLAQDIVRALRLFNVRAVFATHLHELAEGVEAINREVTGDSLVVSLVAGVELRAGQTDVDVSTDLVPRTYKIKPGPPKGHSYAKGIAVRYGISFEQLAGQWQERQEPRNRKANS